MRAPRGKASAPPEPIGPVLLRVVGKVRAQSDELAGFTCYGRRGVPLLCRESESAPEIPTVFGWATCPVAQTEQCAPWGRHEARGATTEASRWVERAIAAQVPRRLWAASWASRATPALERALVYWRTEYSKGRCWLVSGDTGLGKSWASVAVLRAAGVGTFLFFPALCSALMDSQRRVETLGLAKRAPFVVLDDLGAQYDDRGGFLESLLYEIIWWREANMLPTIVTTNRPVDELRALSPRILDRLRGEWGAVSTVTGQTLRKRESA
jgi:hypothetical protein